MVEVTAAANDTLFRKAAHWKKKSNLPGIKTKAQLIFGFAPWRSSDSNSPTLPYTVDAERAKPVYSVGNSQ